MCKRRIKSFVRSHKIAVLSSGKDYVEAIVDRMVVPKGDAQGGSNKLLDFTEFELNLLESVEKTQGSSSVEVATLSPFP